MTSLARAVGRPLGSAAVLACALAVAASPLHAQEPQATPPMPSFASPFLPATHWARDAARRLWALGLVGKWYDPGTGLLTRRDAAHLFRDAVARAEASAPALAPLARGYFARFAGEFGPILEVAEAAPHGRLVRGAGRLEAGYERLTGRVGAGTGYAPGDWTGAVPIPDTITPFAAVSLSGSLHPYLSLRAVPAVGRDGLVLREGEVTAAWRALGVWAGRRRVAYGPSEGGGIVLGGGVAFDGVGGFLVHPIRFPWIFRVMGPIHIESFLSRVSGGDSIRNPYFIGFRGTMTPNPRVTVGLNRAAMFGGEGNLPITLHNMAFLLVGGTGHAADGSGAFANDVLSVDAEVRPPLGPLPVELYGEWGMDDSHGAYHHVPGFTAGGRLAALPGVPQVGLGLERTIFAVSCCGNPIWYRNYALRNGWADAGIPVGSPLAGNGSEWLAFGDAALLAARVRLRAQAFTRDRGDENLLAPQRAGTSRGGRLDLEVRTGPSLEVGLSLAGERAAGGRWRTAQAVASLQLLF